MDTDERLELLEKRIAEYDTLIGRLIAYGRLTRGGRLLLKAVGL